MACRHLLPGAAAHTTSGALGSLSGGHGSYAASPQLHLAGDPGEAGALEDLWRAAARGFVTVVQTGLPSINICSSQVGWLGRWGPYAPPHRFAVSLSSS
jgi:hypothetical protein